MKVWDIIMYACCLIYIQINRYSNNYKHVYIWIFIFRYISSFCLLRGLRSIYTSAATKIPSIQILLSKCHSTVHRTKVLRKIADSRTWYKENARWTYSILECQKRRNFSINRDGRSREYKNQTEIAPGSQNLNNLCNNINDLVLHYNTLYIFYHCCGNTNLEFCSSEVR